MALTKVQRTAILDRWMRLHRANYLRYGQENGHLWLDRSSFDQRALVIDLVQEQDELLSKMAAQMGALGGVIPPPGWPEDVTYLNYVHLPVMFRRAVDRMSSIAPGVRADVADLERHGHFELADVGEAFASQLEAQVAALKPHCASSEQLSPA